MELKKFVLNGQGIIHDLKVEKTLIGTDCATLKYGTYLKTSDNILDLVEIGDLVKCGIIAYTVTDVDRWGNLTLNLGDVIEGRNSAITAIYKRQLNGDYKRYEVKE